MVDDAEPLFGGTTYEPSADEHRLRRQLGRVCEAMRDGIWRTLGEISTLTGDPEASVSARLRDLRKTRFGAWVVERRARGERRYGLYEYRLLPPDPAAVVAHDARGGPTEEVPNASELALVVRELRALAPIAKQAGAPYSATLIRVGRWLKAGAPRG